MASADQQPTRPKVAKIATMLGVASLLISSCAIDRTTTSRATQVAPPTVAVAQIEPTPPPPPPPTAAAVPTPTIEVIPTPTPAPVPTPTTLATTLPPGPPPLPTRTADDALIPEVVQPGLVRIPVGITSFVLAEPRPVLQLNSHTLIYVDDEQQAEVDIFTPYASRDGDVFADYQAVIDYLNTDEAFTQVSELPSVSIAGLATRVFAGTGGASLDRAFYTDEIAVNFDRFGWFPPVRMQMWVIDHPRGTIIVSAESLQDPGQFSEAIRLATEVLSTINFE